MATGDGLLSCIISDLIVFVSFNNGNFHHNQTLYRESEAQASWGELEEGSSQRSNPAFIASEDLSLYRPRPKIYTGTVSKVLDSNGEQLVMNHGTKVLKMRESSR
jgi:hypothetical protein